MTCQATDMLFVQVVPRDDIELASALQGIQRAAYAVEAGLIGDNRIPGLQESVEELQAAELLWLVASSNGNPVGAIAWSEDGDQLDIDRLIVAPEVHRRGVGSALIRHVMQRAGIRRISVSTGRDNVPAKTMYERLGFVRVDEVEVLPGLMVTNYGWLADGLCD